MRATLVSAILALLAAAPAGAAVVYAPNGLPRPYPFTGPDELIMFDSSDPANFVVIGSMNVPNIGFGGMDFDRDGNLWAYASFYKNTGGAASGLYRVDLETGQATVQGTPSTQPLEDLAFNPVDNSMYGIRTQNSVTRLYRVNLSTGATTLVGVFTGLPASQHAMSFAIDSAGNYFVHDINADKMYWGAGLALTELYTLPQDTNYSQGMTIDWSNGDVGYHAAVGQGIFPDYFSQVNTFATDGSGYVLGPDFGPNEYFPPDPFGYPLVEPGDLAIVPTPCYGDIDGNGGVDLADLSLLLGNFGLTGGGLPGDLNDDGYVDLSDLSTLLVNFGALCP
jgi:hypothetical protein